MKKTFNVSADCKPELHYMVNISDRLEQIKAMVDAGQYFTINRARQYGKTTTLRALARFLKNDYAVASLDFQMMSHANFASEQAFATAFSEELLDHVVNLPKEIQKRLNEFAEGTANNPTLLKLFRVLSKWCGESEKKLVLIIDEVDSAADNQVFLDFLALLRGYYINRDVKPTFQSVILAGVYDVKNIKRKLRPDDEQKMNSPWNIAADFEVDMHFSAKDIGGMLEEYENDYETGMDIEALAHLLYEYTAGYPFLVSRLCKLIDERIAGSEKYPDKSSAWTKAGFLAAVKMLLEEKNTLFESLIRKVYDYPELKNMIYLLLFQGQNIAYNPDDLTIDMALMFGFVKIEQESVVIANRIFETRLYNMFLTLPEVRNCDICKAAFRNRNQFTKGGRLDMRLVLEKFLLYFQDIYGDQEQKFLEEDGRRLFLLYLKPIINGAGNYYIEAQTRNAERTDVIVDYLGEQYVVEMKIWRGNAYNMRGEKQLLAYLDYYHMEKGYMLSFNFNKQKDVGVREIFIEDKILVEAVV